MAIKETRMAKSWNVAARDLSVEFVSPFIARDSSGLELVCSGWLPHFGGPKGAVILSRDDTSSPGVEDEFEFLWELGYWASGLSPYSYERYNRRSFVETLRDWGWYGPEDSRPIWFLENSRCDDKVTCEACQHAMHTVDPAICSKQKPCAACVFYNKVPYWTNPDWQRRQRRKTGRRASLGTK